MACQGDIVLSLKRGLPLLFHYNLASQCSARSSQSINIGIDLLIDKSIKIGKSDLIDIHCIDQSVEIDDTLVSFIDLS